MASCSEDTALKDALSQKWQQALNGQADGKQNWVTAIDMQLNIIDNNGSTVSAYTIGDETPVLLGQKVMKGMVCCASISLKALATVSVW